MMDLPTFLAEGRAVIGILAGRYGHTHILCWVRQLDAMWVVGLPVLLLDETASQLATYQDIASVMAYPTFQELRAAFMTYDDSEAAQHRASLVYSTLSGAPAGGIQ